MINCTANNIIEFQLSELFACPNIGSSGAGQRGSGNQGGTVMYRIAENFHGIKFVKPSYLCSYCTNFRGIKFSPICGKGHHICYAIFNTGEKFAGKIFTNESWWQNW